MRLAVTMRLSGGTPEKWGIRCFTDTSSGGPRLPAKRQCCAALIGPFLNLFLAGPFLPLRALHLTHAWRLSTLTLSHLQNPNSLISNP